MGPKRFQVPYDGTQRDGTVPDPQGFLDPPLALSDLPETDSDELFHERLGKRSIDGEVQ
jgi:hypothetical protein